MKYISKVISFYKDLIAPRSKDKNKARREYILNVLLVNAIVLSFVFTLSSWMTILLADYFGYEPSGLSPYFVLFAFLFFLLCYVLSRKGLITVAAYLLLFVYFAGATYTAYRWGINVPQVVLTYALIVVTAGIVLNSRSAFSITLICTIILFSLASLQMNNIIPISTTWLHMKPHVGDATVYSVTLFVIAVVAWLSNREMEQALRRAENSEEALREERDNLEVILEERTKALQKTQIEQMAQLERFAEFGRISSGLVHDLSTPLNLVSLNLQRLNAQERKKTKEHIVRNGMLLSRAITGIRRLESFVAAARRQIGNQEMKERFSLGEEINQVLQVLSYYAKEHKVILKFSFDKDVTTYGYPVKFHQVMTNLIVNAIGAYQTDRKEVAKREVFIRLNKLKNTALIEVQDYGDGIAKEHMAHIFKPFFTTKKTGKNMGIGLSICKDIAERDFDGDIAVISAEKKGTIFTFAFPIKRKK
jgi:signal transduction histidine kinase